MKTKTVLSLLCMLGSVGWYLSGCGRIESYSEVPEIHFKKLVFVDSLDALGEILKKAVITFSFIDGDGDLGVRPQEKNPDGTYKPGGGLSRVYYTWHQKKSDGTYEPYQFPEGDVTISSEIPYSSVMDKSEAQNQTLKGTIQIKLDTPKKPKEVDIMRIEFYITDRANHQSNIEYTPDFSILNPSESIE